MKDLKGRNSRSDGGAADPGKSLRVVLVCATLSSVVDQPQVALVVQNSLVHGVGSCDVPVDRLGAHLHHIGTIVVGDGDQFLSIVQPGVVGIDIKENGPLGRENTVGKGVHAHVAFVVNRQNSAIVE